MTRIFLGEGRRIPGIGEELLLSPEQQHHLCHVLRRRPGDPVLLLDGEGAAAEGQLLPGAAVRIVGLRRAGPAAPPVPRITLLLGLLKGAKLDLVVQKATELGVDCIVPVACARSVRRISPADAWRQAERWHRIATGAAEQSQRDDVPEIAPVLPLPAALDAQAAQGGLRLVLLPGAPPLRRVLPPELPAEIAVLVGPEGGLPPEEVEAAAGAGFVPCSLGPRILRAETAALAVLAILSQMPDI